MSTTYEQLFAIANAQDGLCVTFQTDLTVHDRRSVETYPDRPFAWLLYEHGTHLLWLDGPDTETLKILRCFRECFTGGEHMWFVFDGSTVVETSYHAIRSTVWEAIHKAA